MSVIALLGPQRLQPTLAGVVDTLEISGSLAAVTAGWQERESEDDEMREHLGGRTRNLELYRRAEAVFDADPELAEGYRQRQRQLRRIQELYRMRLAYALRAARDLLRRSDSTQELAEARIAAIEDVRRLDAKHAERLRQVHHEFEQRLQPLRRAAVERQRRKIAERLSECSAVAIAGGHVAVLLNRLRLFGAAELFDGKPIIAWSAGAMALAERVVVFHDSPPQGPGDAELLESGLGLYPGLLPLPHARRRLRLEHRRRVELFSRRFAPTACVPLDEGAQLFWNGGFWSSPEPIPVLATDGAVRRSDRRLRTDDAG